jgi:hypothetical protein
MSDLANNDNLKNRYYLSLVVRLTLDQAGRLIHGELLDTTDTLRKRFTTLAEMNETVAVWLKQQELTNGKQDGNTLISNSGTTTLSIKD